MNASSGQGPAAAFATTRWTLVLHARGDSPQARVALGELCEAYWGPVFQFIRRTGRDDEQTRDLTQEFFARLLAGHGVDSADPARGRFRSFLLGAVRHFLADMRDRETAAKRGGGCEVISMDARNPAETGTDGVGDGAFVDPRGPAPDTWFDREWAVHLVNRAVDALASEQAAAGRREAFGILKSWLLGEVAGTTQAEAAAQLGWSENAVRVAVHRLRRRFRELVKTEIAQTVGDSGQVGEELRYLLTVLTSG